MKIIELGTGDVKICIVGPNGTIAEFEHKTMGIIGRLKIKTLQDIDALNGKIVFDLDECRIHLVNRQAIQTMSMVLNTLESNLFDALKLEALAEFSSEADKHDGWEIVNE